LLIDTGASMTAIDSQIIQALSLPQSGSVQIHTPSTGSTPHTCKQYDVAIALSLSNQQIWWLATSLAVTESNLSSQGIDGLLGCDVLSQCVVAFNGPAGHVTLAV
jgi:predicted aspartyl protease